MAKTKKRSARSAAEAAKLTGPRQAAELLEELLEDLARTPGRAL